MNAKVCCVCTYAVYKEYITPFFIIEGKTDCLVADLLVFFTGADRMPPLGFDKQLKVSFIHVSSSKFCTASTCDLQLRLPTCHGEDYEAFREAMVMSLKDNDGFGGL